MNKVILKIKYIIILSETADLLMALPATFAWKLDNINKKLASSQQKYLKYDSILLTKIKEVLWTKHQI